MSQEMSLTPIQTELNKLKNEQLMVLKNYFQ